MKKLLLPIIGLFLLFGCDDSPDNYVEKKETPVVEVIQVVDPDEPQYTENDVFSFYTSCLLTEGIKEDDYCEEICADEFDYDSCDFAEDTISDILSAGKDLKKEKAKRYSHKVVKSESTWFKKGSPKCGNNKCTQTYYKTIYYKDGSSSKSYKTESYTKKNMNSATKTTTGSTSTTTSKYSSNLTATNQKEDTSKTKSSTITTNTTNTTSTTASKYSSNLTATKPKEEVKEEVAEESSIGVGEVAVGAAAVGTAAALTTKTKSKSKTVKKDTGWIKSGSPYSCGSYSPSASSKTKGKKFKQTRSCKQKEIRTITYSDGSVEKSSRVTSASQSKEVIGTKFKQKTKKKKKKNKK